MSTVTIQGDGYRVEAVARCKYCFRDDRPLGVVHRPGKSIGLLCDRCWAKRGKSMERGHQYRWDRVNL